MATKMNKPANILLAAALCLGACERQANHRPPQLKPARVQLEALLGELQGEFARGYQRSLEGAEPLSDAITAALADEVKLHHRPVLAAAYGVSPALRFTQPTGLTPAGELLRTTITAAATHGLNPETLHASRIELERQALLTRTGRQATPAPPSPSELAPLTSEIEALAHKPGPRERPAVTRLISWLLNGRSPIPRLAAAFKQARGARRAQIQATARLELTLADGLLHYAYLQDRGNLNPIKQRARHFQEQQKDKAAEGQGPSPKERDPAAEKLKSPRTAAEKLSPLEVFLNKGPEAYIQSRLITDLAGVQGPAQLRRLLEQLPPRHPQYKRLVKALGRYRAMEQAGGWPTLASTTRLRRGRRHPTVSALKRRLALEGFFKGPVNDSFDANLARAVEAFQETHQLKDAPRLTPRFWRALNVPASQRVRSIELTLQRWRESGIGRSSYYVLVNIPDFHLEVWKAGKRLARHRVIVGRSGGEKCDEQTEQKVRAYATPIQSALIKTLIFCPYWNVTRFIKETELDPEQGKDPLYYPKHGFEVMRPGTRGEWVRELPGPANSLGFVKFIFPNPHETYVHDTPDKGLFNRTVRAFSHGCMRVQSPWELAKLLLTEDRQWDEATYRYLLGKWRQMDFRSLTKQWDPDLYDHMVKQAEELETRVELSSWVDIFVEYYTVRVDGSGRVHFLTDIYGLDQQRLDPRPPRPCTPESKSARLGIRSVPRRLAALEQTAALLAPRVLLASALIHGIKPAAPGARRLIKKMTEVSKFNQYHQSLTRRIREAHEVLDLALKKRGYRWTDRLQEQAIQVERLITALDALGRKAGVVSDQVIKLARKKR